ncbi:Rieske (2Fe-2S) protein [filamentous cyanobacterium CCP1]|nr:Rieske (2Fe-2S) protein [filamentous cyanobacterium CCP2]PSB67664.1 Rieske (2Fe-2S) protein [filamentous cyanobacterium CCP1]
MEYVTVARVEDIPQGQTRLVEVEQQPVLLIHESDGFYAVEGLCSHQNLPLEGGQVWRGVLDCPWHHFQYDIRTGENLYPQRVYPLDALPQLRSQVNPLKTYPVRIVNQEIQIQLIKKN